MHTDSVGPGGDAHLQTEITEWNHEFQPKTLTLGLSIGDESRGYPRSVVADAGGHVTDTLGGTEILVSANATGIFACEGKKIEFEGGRAEDRLRGDGTTWDVVTGRSEDGRRLHRLPGRRLFAFTWQDDHGPGTFYEG